MLILLDWLKNILSFPGLDTIIWAATLGIAVWARNSWFDNERFKEKLKLLDKLEVYIKKYASFLEKDNLFANKDQEKLKELKTDIKYIILDFECIFEDEKWNNILKEHLKDIIKLANGYNAFSLSIEKSLEVNENIANEIQNDDEYYSIISTKLRTLYFEAKKDLWARNNIFRIMFKDLNFIFLVIGAFMLILI